MNKFEKRIKMMILETLLKEEEETLEEYVETGLRNYLYNNTPVDTPTEEHDRIELIVKEYLALPLDIMEEVNRLIAEASEKGIKEVTGASIGGLARATTLSPPSTRLEKVKKNLETAVDMADSAGFLDEKYKKHVSKDGINTSQIIRDRLMERETEVRGELKKLKDLEEQLSGGLEIIDIVMIDQIQELTDEINHREGEKVLRTAWTKRAMSKDPAPRPEFAQEGKK